MIPLLIHLLIILLVFGVILYLLSLFPAPNPKLQQALYVIILLIMVLYLLYAILPLASLPPRLP
jgi:hypothetical protein